MVTEDAVAFVSSMFSQNILLLYVFKMEIIVFTGHISGFQSVQTTNYEEEKAALLILSVSQ